MTTPDCQRWRERRDSYRPAGEVIDTTRYGVEVMHGDREARAFIERHHYSGTYVAARLRVGLYRTRNWLTPELVGVAVFSVPASQAVIPKWTGLPPKRGVELGRLVLLDDVPANGESWFVARAFKAVRRELPCVSAVLSCSDPLVRRRADGSVLCPGHVGTVYQALNGRHVGMTSRRRLVIGTDGRTLSARALSKIRNEETGWEYACRQLVSQGAPSRRIGEPLRDWLTRALRDGPFTSLMHPGTLVYTWGMPKAADYDPERLARLPYPKQPDALHDPQDVLS